MATLILADGTQFHGRSFGAQCDCDGEVVFNTGMVGYPESMTDPSYRGQVLVFTYPLIGNYGVPSEEKNAWPARRSDGSVHEGGGFSKNFESEGIHVRGIVVDTLSEDHSHFASVSSLSRWMEHHKIPGIRGVDTRALTKKLREHGVMLGRIVSDAQMQNAKSINEKEIQDPNKLNLVAEVSCKEPITYEPEGGIWEATIVAFDCGMKRNILRSFLKRGIRVHRVPWDFDLSKTQLPYDGVFISNGPGDPKICLPTIAAIRWAVQQGIPTFGICLGNQLMALAVGGDTYKLKYGHRGANQPCIESPTPNPSPTGGGEKGIGGRCIITSQNHGFAVDAASLPKGWHVWFTNANDGSVEGIAHESGKFRAVQFHPEAAPGPEDANYLFDEFIALMKGKKN